MLRSFGVVAPLVRRTDNTNAFVDMLRLHAARLHSLPYTVGPTDVRMLVFVFDNSEADVGRCNMDVWSWRMPEGNMASFRTEHLAWLEQHTGCKSPLVRVGGTISPYQCEVGLSSLVHADMITTHIALTAPLALSTVAVDFDDVAAAFPTWDHQKRIVDAIDNTVDWVTRPEYVWSCELHGAWDEGVRTHVLPRRPANYCDMFVVGINHNPSIQRYMTTDDALRWEVLVNALYQHTNYQELDAHFDSSYLHCAISSTPGHQYGRAGVLNQHMACYPYITVSEEEVVEETDDTAATSSESEDEELVVPTAMIDVGVGR